MKAEVFFSFLFLSVISGPREAAAGLPQKRLTSESEVKHLNGLENYEKIIGGSDAERGEFPWQVSIQEWQAGGTSAPFCGGAIIDPTHVVTAAHCLLDISYANIQVGLYSLYAANYRVIQK
jgi:secreted trypsin-like serine protease